MANQAAKKRMQSAESMSKRLLGVIALVNVLYVVFRFVLGKEYEEFSNWQWAGFLLHCIVSTTMYRTIVDAETQGLPYNYSFDAIAINLVVQAGSIYSEWFWLLYLAIPAFVLYKIGGMLLGWVFQEEPEPTAQETKAAMKKARQAERARKLGKMR